MTTIVKLNDELRAEINGEGAETTITLLKVVGMIPANAALFQALIPCFVKPQAPKPPDMEVVSDTTE